MTLQISDELKAYLKSITPFNYTGIENSSLHNLIFR